MTDFLRAFTDDQLAVMGCVLALLAGGLLLQLTYAFGPASRSNVTGTVPEMTRIPQPVRRAADRAA